MEELFNVALVIIYGFINQKLSNLKMKLKLKYLALNLMIMIWKIKKIINFNEKLSKTEETNKS
jgi:hypothetical protein